MNKIASFIHQNNSARKTIPNSEIFIILLPSSAHNFITEEMYNIYTSNKKFQDKLPTKSRWKHVLDTHWCACILSSVIEAASVRDKFDSLVQDCSISIALTMEIPQSCINLFISWMINYSD